MCENEGEAEQEKDRDCSITLCLVETRVSEEDVYLRNNYKKGLR